MMGALPASRLRRVLRQKNPGDTVRLVVVNDGRRETRAVVLAESPMARSMRTLREGRRVLGVGFSQNGSIRDTAGLLVISVTDSGAADRAGILEGDRIVSIDEIDLRVPSIDAGTSEGAEARISRLRRHLDSLRDSQPVRLSVLSDGRAKSVSLTPTRERGWYGFTSSGDGDLAVNLGSTIRESVARSLQDGTVQRSMARLRDEVGQGTYSITSSGETVTIANLSVAIVDRDFAAQLGRGSENGVLVLRARDTWAPLKAGDVLLSIDGRSTRDGDRIVLRFERDREQRLDVLRAGKRETLTLPARR
jgi:S1-C subfamily serine protease